MAADARRDDADTGFTAALMIIYADDGAPAAAATASYAR